LQSLEIKDIKTGETKDLAVNGLFYAIGQYQSYDILFVTDNQDTNPPLPL
jgi:thioredoxin reductase